MSNMLILAVMLVGQLFSMKEAENSTVQNHVRPCVTKLNNIVKIDYDMLVLPPFSSFNRWFSQGSRIGCANTVEESYNNLVQYKKNCFAMKLWIEGATTVEDLYNYLRQYYISYYEYEKERFDCFAKKLFDRTKYNYVLPIASTSKIVGTKLSF